MGVAHSYCTAVFRATGVVLPSSLRFLATQPPDGLNSGGTDGLQQVSPTVHERRKPAVIARHSVHQDRRPWRDPDLHPEDIHFRHEVATGLERGGYPEDIHFRHEVATGLERGSYPKDIHFRHGLGGGNRYGSLCSPHMGTIAPGPARFLSIAVLQFHSHVHSSARHYSAKMKFQVSVAMTTTTPCTPLVTMQIGCIPDLI